MPGVVEKSFGFLEHYAGYTNGCVPSSAMSSESVCAAMASGAMAVIKSAMRFLFIMSFADVSRGIYSLW